MEEEAYFILQLLVYHWRKAKQKLKAQTEAEAMKTLACPDWVHPQLPEVNYTRENTGHKNLRPRSIQNSK